MSVWPAETARTLSPMSAGVLRRLAVVLVAIGLAIAPLVHGFALSPQTPLPSISTDTLPTDGREATVTCHTRDNTTLCPMVCCGVLTVLAPTLAPPRPTGAAPDRGSPPVAAVRITPSARSPPLSAILV